MLVYGESTLFGYKPDNIWKNGNVKNVGTFKQM